MAEEIKPEKNSGHGQDLRLSTRDLPREQQFELWRNVMSEASAPMMLEIERPDEGFAADMLLRSFGMLQLAYSMTNTKTRNPVQLTRTRSEVARTAEHALILVYRMSESPAMVRNNADSVKLGVGDWCLFSTEDRLSATCHQSSAQQLMVRIPGNENTPVIRAAENTLGVPRLQNNMANILVSDYIKTLVRYPMPDAAQAAAIGRHFVDLLALALDQTPEQFEASETGVRAALVMAIQREIEAQYLDHEFSPVRAAANLRITPRYLHKILEPTGMSFSERVMQRRLQHAQALLSSPSTVRLGILGVALDSGFRNAEHFSQRFRAAFGMTPREFRNGRISRPDA